MASCRHVPTFVVDGTQAAGGFRPAFVEHPGDERFGFAGDIVAELGLVGGGAGGGGDCAAVGGEPTDFVGCERFGDCQQWLQPAEGGGSVQAGLPINAAGCAADALVCPVDGSAVRRQLVASCAFAACPVDGRRWVAAAAAAVAAGLAVGAGARWHALREQAAVGFLLSKLPGPAGEGQRLGPDPQ